MACVVVPAVEALIVTAAAQIVLAHENKLLPKVQREATEATEQRAAKIPFSRKLRWLSSLLWGGTLLLAFEHVWHGEIVPWAPVLTAAATPAQTAVMLREMSTVGVAMAVLVTAVWGAMALVSARLEKNAMLPARAE
jgi:hypothetical protein